MPYGERFGHLFIVTRKNYDVVTELFMESVDIIHFDLYLFSW